MGQGRHTLRSISDPVYPRGGVGARVSALPLLILSSVPKLIILGLFLLLELRG